MQAREGRETNHKKIPLLAAIVLTAAFMTPSGLAQAGPGKSKGAHKTETPGIDVQEFEAAGGVPGDFNADGLADVLWRNPTTGANVLWQMNGLSRDSEDLVDPADPLWQIEGVGDFNGDSRADILWRHPESTNTVVWQMDGEFTQVSANVGSVSAGWQVEGLGDFNGDGKTDILWRNASTKKVFIWQMDGVDRFDKAPIGAVGVDWSVDGIGDFDGDGMVDILWRNVDTGEIVMWQMDGFLRVDEQSIETPDGAGWRIAGVGDFDGDWKADILWRGPNLGNGASYLKIGLMDGFAMMEEQTIGMISLVWAVAQVRDYNGSGQADILWRNPKDERVVVWQMNGFVQEGAAVVGEFAADWEVN